MPSRSESLKAWPEDALRGEILRLDAEVEIQRRFNAALTASFVAKNARFVGALAAVNSALFLIALLAIGVLWDNAPVIVAAIATFGICFLSYASQAMFAARTRLNIALVAASIVSGAIGFILLLVW